MAVSQNDDFWSGSQNDPYGNQPPGQSRHFGDSGFGAPPQDPYGRDPYQQDPYRQDPQGQDPYQQDPYQQDAGRRKLLATGPHEFGESWVPDDPFEESFTPPRGRDRGGRGGRGGGGGNRGFIASFAVAALLVALAAGAYAVYSVLQESDSGDDAFLLDSTTTTIETTTTVATTTTLPPPPPGLNIVLDSPDFVCDGTVKQFGTISGATPDEEIAFTSPQSSNLRSGQADANGQLPIRWVCDPDQIGKIWELTATGAVSGLSGTVTFTGVAEGQQSALPDDSQTTVTTQPELGDMAITITENPFACNGTARVFGTISGATPNGTISFTSPQASNIRSGEADASGNRDVRWVCDAAQAGTIWQLTATDDATGRTVVWELTGN